MTDTTAHEGYECIEWADVREGDVLFHENGDRLTVDHVGVTYVGDASGRLYSPDVWGGTGFFPYRKVEPIPTTPGHYLDAKGYHWKLTSDANRPWYMSVCDRNFTAEKMAKYAPFTRLVPMPTEEQIRETLFKTDPGTIYGVDAVVDGMKSLLGGGDDD